MNNLFDGDDQMAVKLRQKFGSKKALHWFLVHKAVSDFLLIFDCGFVLTECLLT